MSTQAGEAPLLDRSNAPAGPVASTGTDGGLVKTFKDVLAGTTGGIAVTLVGHPFDTLKMLFRATLFGAYGKAKEYLQAHNGGSLSVSDYYKAGAMTGFAAAFTEGPIDFYKSQIQVQIVRSKADPIDKVGTMLKEL
eukprot:jgi/Pico_ML_1/52953/g3584.t1